jgi:hypothetical protein
MPKLKSYVDERSDECMQCIKEIRGLLHRPNELGQTIRDESRRMMAAIAKMKQTGMQNGSKDLDSLYSHLDQICCLTNQMETGDLMIRGDHAMQAAYQRLP